MRGESRRHLSPASAAGPGRPRGGRFRGRAGRPAGLVRPAVLVRKTALPAADAAGWPRRSPLTARAGSRC
jgi:hypothetical protein